MADLSQINLKNVDLKTIDCVNGYIRESQKLFYNNDNPYYYIPELVNRICILYYFLTEFFAICGDDIFIGGGEWKKEVRSGGKMWACAYGNIEIDPRKESNVIYEWHLQLHSLHVVKNSAFWMSFGISSNSEILNDFGTNVNINSATTEHHAYAYHVGVDYIYSDMVEDTDQKDLTIRHNDILIMRLNLKDKKVEFHKNDHEETSPSVAINDTVKYRMMICICDTDAIATLIDFKRITL